VVECAVYYATEMICFGPNVVECAVYYATEMICFGPNWVEMCAICYPLGYWDDMFSTKFGRFIVYYTCLLWLRSALLAQIWSIMLSQIWSTSLRPDMVYFNMSQIWSTCASLRPDVVYFSRTRCGLFHYEPDLVYFTTTRCGLLQYTYSLTIIFRCTSFIHISFLSNDK